MKKCDLIATIPAMTDMARVKEIIRNPYIYGVRWNTGVVSPYSEMQTVEILKDYCAAMKKPLWIDLKGRQLRVTEWGNPLYDSIKINHNVTVKGPAKVLLRGEEPLDLVKVQDNNLFVRQTPRHAVGKGQSLNIICEDENGLEIEGYLTKKDKAYIQACRKYDVENIMASYVESINDVIAIKLLKGACNVVCKIESKKGVKAIDDLSGLNLMAARDDLYLEVETPVQMSRALGSIIKADKDAICASRIFSSLEYGGKISFCDYEDLEVMYAMGYHTFMLCDNICNYYFERAIKGWCTFINEV